MIIAADKTSHSAGGGMSHSSGIGQDVQEATNGVDTSDSPEACHWMSTHGSTSLDGDACLERDKQEGTVKEIQIHTHHGTDPVCRQTYKNSSATHTTSHTSNKALPHTDELLLDHTSHSQPMSESRSDVDTVDSAHAQHDDGCVGEEKVEIEREDDTVKTFVDNQQTADISVQVRPELSTSHCLPV